MSSDGFVVRTGYESVDAFGGDRAQQVGQAWESLRQIRRLVQPERPDLPAPWETAQPLRAVALALEAAGIAFCTVDSDDAVVVAGVQVQSGESGRVRVIWRYRRGERPADAGEAELGAAAAVLGRCGWDALVYRAGRGRYLLVEPGREAWGTGTAAGSADGRRA